MYPGKSQYFLNIFQSATNKPYGYLFVDRIPATKENVRLRGNVFYLSPDSIYPYNNYVTPDPVVTNGIKDMPVATYCQLQSDHRPVNTPESQVLDYMPSCDDFCVL